MTNDGQLGHVAAGAARSYGATVRRTSRAWNFWSPE